ncbi:unnamed protein product [Paramecium octaurelia]|uniref:protein-tyrosine-phosphatase n=1 Tax=Paramecium octaurelia TaxID=43137 RepID=A0A8S1T6R3_PAROT|nr:unnamed protein product [Paramecium octaurelia]
MIQQLNKWDCILEPILKNNVYIAGLYLADIDCALSLDLLQSLQIGALLSVIDEPKVDASAYIIHEVINIPDCTQQNIQDYFPQTNQFIEQHRQHTNVMVHCFAGISRSASVIIAYLMFKFQWGFQTALNYVVSKRPQVKPNFGFIQQLIQYDKQNKIRQSSQQHQHNGSNPNKTEKHLSQSDSKSNRQQVNSKLDLNQLDAEIAQRQQELLILKLQYQQLNEKIISRNTNNKQSQE